MVLAESVPSPVYTAPPPILVLVAVASIEKLVVVLTLVGFWAPQRLSTRQSFWHVVWPLPQAATHWFPYSWHSKKGMVWVKLLVSGVKPFPQTQSKSRVSWIKLDDGLQLCG